MLSQGSVENMKITNVFISFADKYKDYSGKINWFVFLLIIIFSYGSWIQIFGFNL